MLRANLIARASSTELTAWMALYMVRAEEARHRQDVIDSGDGQVIVSGLGDDDNGGDEDGEGG